MANPGDAGLLPRRLRDSPIAAVVLIGTEVDRTAGLLTLRERGPLELLRLVDTKLLELWFRES
jgi:hypothetical protein